MSTPNPLIPQGTFQAQAARGASNVRIAVATIVAIHVVFFGGLLLQGCKRDTQLAQDADADKDAQQAPSADLALAPLDSNSIYYPNPSALPSEPTSNIAALPYEQPLTGQSRPQPAAPENIWQANNLDSPLDGRAPVGRQELSAGTREYTVVRGDSFYKIAAAHNTTVNAIRAANPNVEPTRIQPGDKLQIPEGSAAGQSSATGRGPAAADDSNIYTVKAGDTLIKIASRNNISVRELSAANNLSTSRINVGQKLKIPTPSGNGASNTNGTSRRNSGF